MLLFELSLPLLLQFLLQFRLLGLSLCHSRRKLAYFFYFLLPAFQPPESFLLLFLLQLLEVFQIRVEFGDGIGLELVFQLFVHLWLSIDLLDVVVDLLVVQILRKLVLVIDLPLELGID